MNSINKVNKLLALTAVLVLCLGVYVAEVDAAIYFVNQKHPKASDQNPGTAKLPWKTIGRAAAPAADELPAVQAGDTVFVKSGIYRERVEVKITGEPGKPITFAAHGGKVTITGADPVTALWIAVGPGVYFAAGWPYDFAKADQDRIDATRPKLQMPGVPDTLLQEWLSTDLDEKQVFVDDDPPLAQVFALNNMVPGTFFVDSKDGAKLYVRLKDDSDPALHVIEASIRTQIFIIHEKHFIRVRGFTMQRGANNIAGLNAVNLTGQSIHFVNNSVLWMSGLGLGVSGHQGYRIVNNRMNHNGWLGVAGFGFKEALFRGNTTSHNGFRWKRIFSLLSLCQDDDCRTVINNAISFAHGGMKLGGVDTTLIIRHRSVGNIYHGIWIDHTLPGGVGGFNRILDSRFSANGGDGIRLEAAHNTEVARNRIVVSKNPVFQLDSTQYGIDLNADHCLVHHNDIVTTQPFSVGVTILGAHPAGPSTGNRIYNNTIVNRASSLNVFSVNTTEPNAIENNIFAHFLRGIVITQATDPSVIIQDYNDFWDIDPQRRVMWSRPGLPDESVPPGSNSLDVDPLFVDEANDGFRLQPDSPVIDQGTFVGLPFCGTSPDMGAHERC